MPNFPADDRSGLLVILTATTALLISMAGIETAAASSRFLSLTVDGRYERVVPRGDGRCGIMFADAECPEGLCCSPNGWCGDTIAHCTSQADICRGSMPTATSPPVQTLPGTQSPGSICTGEPRNDNRCGPMFGNAKCELGLCCSLFGWCGDTEDHCTTESHCQGNGLATEPPTVLLCTEPSRDDRHCGPDYGNAHCEEGECCSEHGWCGVTSAHCTEKSHCLANLLLTTEPPLALEVCTGAVREDGRCGPDFGNAKCPRGLYCSQYGWCGNTPYHRTTESRCQGNEEIPTTPAPPAILECSAKPRGDCRCGPEWGNAMCPKGLCCSAHGYCGDGDGFCTEDSHCKKTTFNGASFLEVEPISDIRAFSSCGDNRRVIALTFDDGPSLIPTATAALLDDLQRFGIPATFFVNPGLKPYDGAAELAQRCSLVQRMVTEGHSVQMHGWDHTSFFPADGIEMNTAEVADEMGATSDWLHACGVESITQFRPPFGEFSHDQAESLYAQHGVVTAMWNLSPNDFYTEHDAADIFARTVAEFEDVVGEGNSVVLLMHDYFYQFRSGLIAMLYNHFTDIGYNFITTAECYQQCEPRENDSRYCSGSSGPVPYANVFVP